MFHRVQNRVTRNSNSKLDSTFMKTCSEQGLRRACDVWTQATYLLLSYSVFTVDSLLYAVTLIFDPVTLILTLTNIFVSPVTWWKWNQTICGGVIAIWIFNLMTFNTLCSRIIYTKFKLSRAIRSWNVTIFYADTLCNAVALITDPLTLSICCTCTYQMWRCRSLTKFEWNRTISGWVIDNLATFCHITSRCDLDLCALTLNVCSKSDVTWSNFISILSETEQFLATLFTIYHFFQGWTLTLLLRRRSTKLHQIRRE